MYIVAWNRLNLRVVLLLSAPVPKSSSSSVVRAVNWNSNDLAGFNSQLDLNFFSFNHVHVISTTIIYVIMLY